MELELLKEKQERDRITDTEMADILCISRGYWNRLKNGRERWNARIAMRTSRLFTEKNLSRDITNSNEDITAVNTDTLQPAPAANPGGIRSRIKQFFKRR